MLAGMESGEQFELLMKVLVALGLGAAVGLEREYRGFEAGIRTNALVCAGAAMFAAVGAWLGDSRMAAALVQGAGFLCAGLIFQRHATVHNMTTAATTWAVAAIGLLVALEFWIVAVGTAAAVVALLELQPISDMVYKRGDRTAEHRDELEGDHSPDGDESGDNDEGDEGESGEGGDKGEGGDEPKGDRGRPAA